MLYSLCLMWCCRSRSPQNESVSESHTLVSSDTQSELSDDSDTYELTLDTLELTLHVSQLSLGFGEIGMFSFMFIVGFADLGDRAICEINTII